MQIDPAFGTEDEFREMCANAARRHGTIIDDIVPGHTGKGADFRLAELNYLDYPGIYHMVDIPQDAWHLLPDVPEGQDSVNLSPEAERALAEAGFIIGELQRVIFYEPGVKETNWSVTPPIYDYRGVLRLSLIHICGHRSECGHRCPQRSAGGGHRERGAGDGDHRGHALPAVRGAGEPR